MSLPNIFSLLFFINFTIYFYFGMYILRFNAKSRMHRVFFYSCLALCVWAFTFCIANSAPDYETSLIWRRIASLGWGTIFSFLLHFILLMTGKNRLLQKKWIYILLYLPAVVNVIVFGLYKEIAIQQYNLVNTYAGWINISVNTLWDWMYNFYYAGFSVIGIILVWNWGISSKEHAKKKQSILLCSSYVVAVLTGTMTEVIINLFFPFKVPQIAPIIILIPISAIFYCIKRYGLIAQKGKNAVADEGHILSEVTRLKLYIYVTRTYTMAAFINFTAQYFSHREPLGSILSFSATMLFIGILLEIIQSLKLNTNIRDVLSNIIMTASIPFIILKYMDTAAIYAWAAPIIFIMVSVAFKQSRMITLISIATLFTLLWIWIKTPITTVTFGNTDHIVRICIFAIALWIAHYINRVYLLRLKENEEQVKLQKLLSHISGSFVSVNKSNIDEMINNMLRLCGEHFKVDHTYLFFLSNDQKTINHIYEWRNLGIEAIRDIADEVTTEVLPRWLNLEQLLHQGSIYIPEVAVLPETSQEKEWLQSKQVKSLIVNPLMNQDTVQGVLGFETFVTTTFLRNEQQEILKVFANLISKIWFKVEGEKEINYRAYYDALTGLPNREHFKNSLEQAINIAKQNETLVGVVFVDIDSFKVINDSMGHEGGDLLLKQMGQRLSSYLRPFDIVSRFGGDEFLIMISQVSQFKDILKEVDKIMEAFKQPVNIKNQEYFVTVSAGIAVFPIDGEDTEDLIKNADMAMYVSKQRGKNKYTLCSPDMKRNILINMDLTNSLYRALDRDELLLYYQPQVSSGSGNIIGLEALIRWQHPEKGMIAPKEFIPAAEKTGLINPIGQWVLQTACRQNKAWQKQGLTPMKMAVNLSVAQFHNPKFVETVKNILQETELDPAYLELEITESIAGDEEEYTVNTLNELKKIGVSISIDDFGTQYSSLSRIKTLPVDSIKIDGQFINGISHSSKDEGIIKVIIQLGKTLGLTVLAERVETEQQLVFLRENFCEQMQGFYFYRPMPAHEVEIVLGNMEV